MLPWSAAIHRRFVRARFIAPNSRADQSAPIKAGPKPRTPYGGFTLVELLVAVVLLATVLTVAASAISAATRAQAAASRRTTEGRLAEAKLAEIQAQGTTDGADEGSFDELNTGGLPGAADWADYHYRWEVATGDIEGLARAQVSVWYGDDDTHPYTLICYRVAP